MKSTHAPHLTDNKGIDVLLGETHTVQCITCTNRLTSFSVSHVQIDSHHSVYHMYR